MCNIFSVFAFIHPFILFYVVSFIMFLNNFYIVM